MSLYRSFGKRTLDVVVALVGLSVAWPVMLVVAGLVRWRLGSPVLFRQQRAGLHGRPFTILKFRSMAAAAPGVESAASDEARLDGFGRVLRATSLDELPELFNVLRGEMSLVGPRPLPLRYLDRYTEFQRRRHHVRPGITGLAQISGRNRLAWEDRFWLDVRYVETCSLGTDVVIMARTFAVALSPHDVHAEGHATMPEFEGGAGETP